MMTHLRIVVAGFGQILLFARSVQVLIRKESKGMDIECGV